jgi:hypothetical protein
LKATGDEPLEVVNSGAEDWVEPELADQNLDYRRYEIRALIGPCTRDEAENAAELVLESLEDDLGPSVSLDEWREEKT